MLTRHIHRYPFIRLAPACLALVFVGGCASSPDETSAQQDTGAATEAPSEAESLIDRYARGLGVEDGSADAKTGDLRANVSPATEAEGEIVPEDDGPDRERAGEGADAPARRAARPSPGLDEQVEAMAEELAVLLAKRAGRDELGVGFGDLARLAALDAVSPGLFNTHFVDAAGATALTEAQRETLKEWRALVVDAVGEMSGSLDEERLALYREIRERESEWRSWGELRLPVAALCTAVYGFGNYNVMNTDEDGRYRLIAGRRYRSVVYVEVDGFTHERTVREGVEGYQSRVALGMSLYQHHEKGAGEAASEGDLLAWKTSEESVEDFSRKRRRDFFLVQTIELPETLSTGRYTLKIRLRDLLSDRQTERRIPIDVVSIPGGRAESISRR